MNRNVAFRRKVIYIAAIALLLIPLYMLGSPSRRNKSGVVGGGYLAEKRAEYRLAQVSLGEIDPAGEAMRLACLGMRGVAANILWTKANYYKKTEQFDEMAATVNQITKLQPNFIKVWEFQAHNLSFNTSVEYDDFRFRYHWVIRGLEFLTQGIRYNRESPKLLWSLGWFTEQKIGRADEKTQFRELFREDNDYHDELRQYIKLDNALGPDRKPDNWLVGQQWMLKAQDLVDNKGVPTGGQSPLIFHASPGMALMYYAMAIEEDGYLGEVGREAWVRAGREWKQYGSREIPTSYGFPIRLNDQEEIESRIAGWSAELDKLAPGVREKLRAEKVAADLSPEERAAWQTPEADRTPQQVALAAQAEETLRIPDEDVAQAAPEANRERARRLAGQIADKQWFVTVIERYRDIVNFVYWRTRCEAEQTQYAIDARKNVYEADRAFEDIDLVEAKHLYEEAWKNWAEIFARFPALLEDVSAEDVVESVQRYRQCLVQLGEPFPEPFILQPLLDLHEKPSRGDSSPAADQPPAAQPAGETGGDGDGSAAPGDADGGDANAASEGVSVDKQPAQEPESPPPEPPSPEPPSPEPSAP